MKKALIEYSNAVDVPEISAIQPASGMPAMPARPVMTASARIAKRNSESVDSVSFGLAMAVMRFPFFSCVIGDRSGADAATSYDGGSGPAMRESHQAAHSEVLGPGEGQRGDGERDRRDDAELGQRQPTGDQHDRDENGEGDIPGEHSNADSPDVGHS